LTYTKYRMTPIAMAMGNVQFLQKRRIFIVNSLW
jgi:hypothetical protein